MLVTSRLLLALSVLVANNAFCQMLTDGKIVQGDSGALKGYSEKLWVKLGLKDLKTSTDDFNFRFSDYGLVIDIKVKNSLVSGDIIHYRFWQNIKHHVKDTLFQRVSIPIQQAEKLYSTIDSNIRALPSDKNIEGWSRGMDGVTYIFEVADKNIYSYKSYWTPLAQRNLKEAIIVQNFVDKLYNILEIESSSKKFLNSLPHTGCYTSGGMTIMCYASNNFEAGYMGSSKFPLGYRLAYNAPYIGKIRTGVYLNIQHQLNKNSQSDLSISAAKAWIFTKKANSHFLYFNYRKREWDISGSIEPDENYKLFYGKNFKKVSLGLGADYLSTNRAKTGGLLYVNKWFNKPRFSIISSSSIFKDQVDYKAEVLKSVFFRNRFFIRTLTFGFNYESFRKVGNAGGSVYVSL